jgi:hypothetical protein
MGQFMAFDLRHLKQDKLLIIEHWGDADEDSNVRSALAASAGALDPECRNILIDVRQSVVKFSLDNLADNVGMFMSTLDPDVRVAYALNEFNHLEESAIISALGRQNNFELKMRHDKESALNWLTQTRVLAA